MAVDERQQRSNTVAKTEDAKRELASGDSPRLASTWAGAVARALELVASGWGELARVCIFLVVTAVAWCLIHGR
jgi:hypothetical protein